ncbi:hypothetical protein [Bacillus sonorensis]|uniref:hypothetical protein n=1 Tax=Bacillus sonorensis TaxID=119858 RepID=UPI00049604BB|nr:hypothetical protein [Bacillus sonorensis]MCF7617034.1 hypothetical protein [Bacillus sonorensis]MCY8036320.1 hypothetical protein [Bacillus sonorensis]MCY8089012.1 hypothetical protein [Bacillus sonorensis]MCY8561861.1 hypothetical protein [Bacillus sonorensis]MCZ0070923.1 hypothetical protein [Bacillus sonorensis]
MKFHNGSAGIGLMVFGLLLSVNTHMQIPAGEAVVQAFGGDARTSSGLHVIALIGLLFIMAGFVMAWLYYRKIAWIRFKLFLFMMGFAALFPLVTEQSMFLLKWNASGAEAIEYIARESSCSYDGDEEEGNMDCTVKVNNYGTNTELVSLSPGMIDEFEYKAKTLKAPPHSQQTYEITFKAQGHDDVSMSGSFDEPEFQIEVLN